MSILDLISIVECISISEFLFNFTPGAAIYRNIKTRNIILGKWCPGGVENGQWEQQSSWANIHNNPSNPPDHRNSAPLPSNQSACHRPIRGQYPGHVITLDQSACHHWLISHRRHRLQQQLINGIKPQKVDDETLCWCVLNIVQYLCGWIKPRFFTL